MRRWTDQRRISLRCCGPFSAQTSGSSQCGGGGRDSGTTAPLRAAIGGTSFSTRRQLHDLNGNLRLENGNLRSLQAAQHAEI
ncbi:unnamed protein product [Cuscuta campestris]|uniref:Uncharacterized protein n=1 Tax=Cuscuta campestris TaxID=132261 RepID=A0A484L7D4_9ASTE|nr:unnamed protein product [Cuscuta campestris]